MKRSCNHLKGLLAGARKITICLDGWSKKNLSTSYLGISACFFDSHSGKVWHAVLNVTELPHPHTGENLADCLESCFDEWDITMEKILLILTDNGANVVKAIKILNERAKRKSEQAASAEDETETESSGVGNDEGDNEVEDDEESEESDDSEEEVEDHEEEEDGDSDERESVDDGADEREGVTDAEALTQLPAADQCIRMKCMAHTLQLVIKKAYVHFDSVIIKARRVVSRIRRSGPSVEQLHASTGKFLITDNSTRWNSTFMMVKRLLEMKEQVNRVLSGLKVDTLLVAEWKRLEELSNLLEPFATQTDILQTDACSLSYAIPALLDLQCHLQGFPNCKTLTNSMLVDMRCRFDFILNPDSPDFISIPAASCLLDPSVATVMLQ